MQGRPLFGSERDPAVSAHAGHRHGGRA
jgi:hypothetical protein